MSEIIRIPLKQIEADEDQPRKTFEEIRGLAKSILNQGLLEPLKVIQMTKNSYRLLDGERRYMALESLSKKDEQFSVANCIVMKPKMNKLITQLSFDVQKNRLPLLEEAEAFKKLIEMGVYTVKELAMLIGKTSEYIKGRLKIASLSEKTKDYIRQGKMRAGALTLVDIDSIRQSEETIVERIIEEKPQKYADYQKIIIEETQKTDAMIELFVSDLIKLKNRIEDFERRSNDIQVPEIQESLGMNLLEVVNTIKSFNKGFDKLDALKKESLDLQDKLNELLRKYGKGTEMTKEIIEKLNGEFASSEKPKNEN